MVESSNVQAKDIESIKELKAKYWRCIDNKMWDEVKECFAEDAVIDFPNGIFEGREAIAQSFKDTLSHGPVAHQGRNLEIELTSNAKAKASWEA
ncbi:nuclear transport factor 2 family protein, partial [Chloroflexota bacterium]